MSITDFATLKARVISFINLSDVGTEATTFIQLAESEFNRALTVREMEASVSLSVSSSAHDLPTDFLAHIALTEPRGSGFDEVQYVAIDYFDKLRGGGASCDRVFTIVGNQMLFKPDISEEADPVEMNYRYRKKLPALSDANPTNWLLDKYPDAYLFGTLAEAAMYIKDEQRMATWLTRRDDVINKINQLDTCKIVSRRRVRPSSAVA